MNDRRKNMTIYALLQLCDDTLRGRIDIMLLSNVAGLPLKTEHKYPIVSTMIAFDETERELFLQLQVSQMFVDSDDRILVKVEY